MGGSEGGEGGGGKGVKGEVEGGRKGGEGWRVCTAPPSDSLEK